MKLYTIDGKAQQTTNLVPSKCMGRGWCLVAIDTHLSVKDQCFPFRRDAVAFLASLEK